MTLRLASYNLHKCKGTDRRRDPGRIIDVLNQTGADVIALQEVDFRLGDRPQALPRGLIERHTDLAALDLALSPVSLGWHGQTLLVRPSLTVTAVRRLELPSLEPRGAIMAELATPAGPLRVVGVHLGLVRRYRLRQMKAIRARLQALPPLPTVIIGDFNEWSDDQGMEPLLDDFTVLAPGRSFHATHPVAALDRLALGHGLMLEQAGVLQTSLSRQASDHLPIWADIALSRQTLDQRLDQRQTARPNARLMTAPAIAPLLGIADCAAPG